MRAHVAVVGAGVAYLLGEHLAPGATRLFVPPDAYSAIVLPWILAVALLIPHAAYAAPRRLAVRASAETDAPRSPAPSGVTRPYSVAGVDEEAD